MKVQLEILEKNGAFYVVNVYETTTKSRIFLCKYAGRINDLKIKIGKIYNEHIDIERSVFDGWY